MNAPQDVEGFYAANFGRLVGAVTLVVGDRQVAEDAVQEAFIRLVPRWHKISTYQDPVAWVRRVALNQASNARRGLARSARVREQWSEAARERAGVGDSELWLILGELSLDDRRLLVLHYVYGLSIREIASDLSCTESAAKSRLSRSRQRFRAMSQLDDEGTQHE